MPAGRDPEFDPQRVSASRVERGLSVVRDRLQADEASVAFVHAGSDADGAYLGGDTVVVTADRAVRLVERGDNAGFTPPVRERVAVRPVDDPAGSVAGVVDELGGDARRVLTPRAVRHDAALFLERAGYDLTSTTALDDARVVKTPAERDAVRALGAAAGSGFDTAVERLAAVDVGSGKLHEAEEPLTAERLARSVAATLARSGVETPGVRVRGVDSGALPAGRPVVVECRPVGPSGQRIRAAWTFVVDGDGGWERRAQLALDAAHRAGRGRLSAALGDEPVTVGEVAGEVRAEVTAYGFEEPSVAVYGVGLASSERPRGGEKIESGQVVVVAASVTREGDETVSDGRRADVVRHVETLCLDDTDGGGGVGVERVVPLPNSLSPSRVLD